MNPAYDIVGRSIRTHPARVFLELDEGTITYGEFGQLVDSFCHAATAAGIGIGDAVGYYIGNKSAALATYFGGFKMGALVVPLNPMLKAVEIAHIVNDARIGLLVVDDDEPDMVRALREVRELLDHDVVFVSQRGVISGTEVWADWILPYKGAEFHAVEQDDDDIACCVYTSGTTGTPKGSQSTHGNLFYITQTYLTSFALTPDDVAITAMPMFTGFAPWFIVQPIAQVGGTVVMHERFDPSRILRDIDEKKATFFCGVPTMYSELVDAYDRASPTPDLSSMRVAGTSGAKMNADMAERVEHVLGCPLGEAYGQTEAGPITISLPFGLRKAGSAGRAPDTADMAILDDDGRVLGAGAIGEIVVRGPMCSPGYMGRPEQTAELWRGGWLHTGDTGYVDEDGFLFTVDRIKEMIITGGMNIYPAEVEATLQQHEAVLHAAVLPYPDDKYGEIPVAVIVLKEGAGATEAEIIAFCRDRIAKYKAPRRVQFRSVMPLSPTGKILRRELREQL